MEHMSGAVLEQVTINNNTRPVLINTERLVKNRRKEKDILC